MYKTQVHRDMEIREERKKKERQTITRKGNTENIALGSVVLE